MKQFFIDRSTTPQSPSLIQVPTEKIPLYPTEQDLLDDLANLEVGQLAGTIDPAESELIGVLIQKIQALENMATGVDVTSDFSIVDQVSWANTPTASLRVYWYKTLKKLKVWTCRNVESAEMAQHCFTLQYNGSNADITFNPLTTNVNQTLTKSFNDYNTTTSVIDTPNSGGFEGSFNIRSANKIRLGGFNRNGNTAWGANITIVAEITL